MLLLLFLLPLLMLFFFACVGTCVPATVESGSLVCGIVADGFSSWGGGMTTTFGCLDATGCGGPCFESGGGGGDGVGEWSGVIGLGEGWASGGLLGRGGESKSENISLICRAMSSSFSSPPVGTVAGRSA